MSDSQLADQRVDDLRGDGVQAGRLERRMVVSDAGTTRAAGAIGLSQRSLMSQRPQRAGLGRRLWPRQRHFGHVNVQIVDKTGMKGPLTWPRRRWRGQGDADVAKERVAWPKRGWRGQREGGVAKEYPVPN